MEESIDAFIAWFNCRGLIVKAMVVFGCISGSLTFGQPAIFTAFINLARGQTPTFRNGLLPFVFLLLFAIIYFLPFLCAYGKDHPTKGAFLLANIFFGWTGVGWLVMLIMAANSKPAVIPVTFVSANAAGVIYPKTIDPTIL